MAALWLRLAVALMLAAQLAIATGPSTTAAAPPSPQAATGALTGIQVITATHENHFPADLLFKLEAKATSPITRAILYYRVADNALSSHTTAELATFTSTATHAEFRLDLRKSYLPPGVRVSYRWQIQSADGQSLSTDWSDLTLEDPRFEWMSLQVANVQLSWYRGGASFGEALREPIARALSQVREAIGPAADLHGPIRILIYGSNADFRSAMRPGAEEWAGGEALPAAGVILISAGPESLDFAKRTVPHELTHAAVYQATKNPFGELPTWLNEGLAVRAEGGQSQSFDVALRQAVAADRLISVWSLGSRFPADPDQAQLSYAESASLVSFVIAHYGPTALPKLLAAFRDGSAYDEALVSALGVDTYGLEDAWRASLGLRPVPGGRAAISNSPALVATPPTGDASDPVEPTTSPTPLASQPSPARSPSNWALAGIGGLLLLGAVGALAHDKRRQPPDNPTGS